MTVYKNSGLAFPGARVLDLNRQPLEDNVVNVSPAEGTPAFPANFTLGAAMNLCPCGAQLRQWNWKGLALGLTFAQTPGGPSKLPVGILGSRVTRRVCAATWKVVSFPVLLYN